MKNLVTLLLLLATSNAVLAEDSNLIEEIVVVGTVSQVDTTDVTDDMSIIEIVMPATSFVAGGYGGFAGFNERGTQTTHTTVYRNGVPANDSGSGWYDFAHDVVSGLETVNIVSGPNSVLYGSGSLGGTVFINDKIEDQAVLRLGEHHQLLNVAILDSISVSSFDVSNDSVRNDNTERDDYKNTSIKSVRDIYGFTLAMSHVDYEYDYDNCYTSSFSQSNECVQEGTRTDISVRNEHVTIGYNKTESEYFTEGVSTYSNDADRYYFDARDTFNLNPVTTIVSGITYDKENYIGESQDDVSGYAVITYNNQLQFGTRVSEDARVYRLGFDNSKGFFANISTSYRNPTLYQQYGDSWVKPNLGLKPEEGTGFEIGYLGLSYFAYDFDENIDYDGSSQQYVNTGEYETKGVRFQDMYAVPYGSLNVFVAYTDTDQPRVPAYKGRISYFASFGETTAELSYTAQFDRDPGPYDGASLDDIKSVDFVLRKQLSDKLGLAFTVQDVLDDVVEVLPGYDAGGRKFFLTLTYK
jgi:outer membrane cobalamin receptor